MKKPNLPFALLCCLFFILTICGCTKQNQDVVYTGKIIGVAAGCGQSGYNVIIDGAATNNIITTNTVPDNLKVAGTAIRFKMRDAVDTDATVVCTALYISYPVKVIYDVSAL